MQSQRISRGARRRQRTLLRGNRLQLSQAEMQWSVGQPYRAEATIYRTLLTGQPGFASADHHYDNVTDKNNLRFHEQKVIRIKFKTIFKFECSQYPQLLE